MKKKAVLDTLQQIHTKKEWRHITTNSHKEEGKAIVIPEIINKSYANVQKRWE